MKDKELAKKLGLELVILSDGTPYFIDPKLKEIAEEDAWVQLVEEHGLSRYWLDNYLAEIGHNPQTDGPIHQCSYCCDWPIDGFYLNCFHKKDGRYRCQNCL